MGKNTQPHILWSRCEVFDEDLVLPAGSWWVSDVSQTPLFCSFQWLLVSNFFILSCVRIAQREKNIREYAP